MTILHYFVKSKFLLFFTLSVLLYGNTLKNEYGLDDNFVTRTGNLTTLGFKSIKQIFTTHYVVEEGGKNTFEYRPLVKLSFALEHQFFGVKPAVSHFINLLLYALCLLILYKLLLLLFANYPPFYVTLIVLIFAVLPTHVEVVAGLKSRDVLLCFLFSGLSFIQGFNFIRSNKIKHLILAFAFLCISFFSKLDSFSFIVLIPLISFFFYPQKKYKIILMLIVFIGGYYTFDTVMRLLIDQSLEKRPVENYENILYFKHTLLQALVIALNTLGFYTKMLLYPNNMACYYGFNTIPVIFTSFYALTGLGTLLIGVAAFIKFMRNLKHPVIIGLTIYFAGIFLYTNLVKPVPGIVGDRFLFTPSVGFAILLLYILVQVLNKKQVPLNYGTLHNSFKLVLLLFLGANLFLVIKRNTEWKDEITLYCADIKHQPNSVKLNNLCGNQILSALSGTGKAIKPAEQITYLKIAEQALQKAMLLDSNNLKTLNNLSFLYLNFYKDFERAKFYVIKAYAKDSLKHEVVYNLALCSYNLGDIPNARKYILKAFNLLPQNNNTLELMTEIYSNGANLNEAISVIEQKMQNQPFDFKLNLLLGNIYIGKHDTVKAITYLQNALTMRPNDQQLGKMIRILSK